MIESESLKLTEQAQRAFCVFNWCLLPTAIAALVIAFITDWDSSSCNDGTRYTIQPIVFLYVAGATRIGYSTLYCLGFFCKQRAKELIEGLDSLLCAFVLFNCAWAVIGLVMFIAECNTECQTEPITLMILSWSIIELTVGPLSVGCAMCITYLASDSRGNRHRRTRPEEREPLINSV
mmetsp:Transcript_6167/g.10169  ORF Transcript_6167/g.10169 Transcript_6167/m.10169 type:complete len:178 (+) Transcript_6167:110-643(+)